MSTISTLGHHISDPADWKAKYLVIKTAIQTFDRPNSVIDSGDIDKLKQDFNQIQREKFTIINDCLRQIKEIFNRLEEKPRMTEKHSFCHNLELCMRKKDAKWKKNAAIIALVCTIFFVTWISLNAWAILALPTSFFPIGFQIILILNFFLVKGLKNATNTEESSKEWEIELIDKHVIYYKEIVFVLRKQIDELKSN